MAPLKSAGVEAISSEEPITMSADLELKKETILNAVNPFKNDAVIITHLIDKEKKKPSHEAVNHIMVIMVFIIAGTPIFIRMIRGYSSTSKTIRLETNLYDV